MTNESGAHEDDHDGSDYKTGANSMRKLVYDKGITDAEESERRGQSANTNVERLSGDASCRQGPYPRMILLDGARGIGILLVLLYHEGYSLFKNAWLCISMFFCLSGFLITASTFQSFERSGAFNVTKFWAARISRIFPILYLALTMLYIYSWLHSSVQETEAIDLIYAALFGTNINLMSKQQDDYFERYARFSITRHLWTLSIEEQYYLVWPMIFISLISMPRFGSDQNQLIVNKPRLRRSLYILAAIDITTSIISYVLSHATIIQMGYSAAYYATWSRMGDIASGGLIYSLIRLVPFTDHLYTNPDARANLPPRECAVCHLLTLAALVILVGLPMVQLDEKDMLPSYFLWLRLVPSLVIFALVLSSLNGLPPDKYWHAATKIMKSKYLCKLGIASYGIYVVHWPFILFWGDAMGRDQALYGDGLASRVSVFGYHLKNMLILAVSIFTGMLSFRYYEMPVMVICRRSNPLKVISTGVVTIIIFVSLILLQARFRAAKDEDYASSGTNFSNSSYIRMHQSCIQNRSVKFLLLGESVAKRIGEAWQPYFDLYSSADSHKGSCQLTLLFKTDAVPGKSTISKFICLREANLPFCEKEEKKHSFLGMKRTISQFRPNHVIIKDGHWGLSKDLVAWKKSLGSELVVGNNSDRIFIGPQHSMLDVELLDEAGQLDGFSDMLKLMIANRVETISFLTGFRRFGDSKFYVEEASLLKKIIDKLKCTDDSEHSIEFQIIDWALILCPRYHSHQHCTPAQMEPKLSDTTHPYREGPRSWPSVAALSATIAGISHQEPESNLSQELAAFSQFLRSEALRFSGSLADGLFNQDIWSNVTSSSYTLCSAS